MRAIRIGKGLVLDGFTLVEPIKLGGMAQIWHVTREGEDAGLVMKIPLILDGDDPTMIVGFEMEQMILPRLKGPHVPRFVANGDFATLPYIVMERLPGTSLYPLLERLPLPPRQQPEIGVSYAAKIEKAEAVLDWRLPAIQLARQVRAFNPFPGAATSLRGSPIKVWQAEVMAASGAPGVIVASDRHGIMVTCGQGALRLTELQRAGGKRLSVAQFLAGTSIVPGSSFDPAP